jgi:hypothetical protein
VGWGHRRPGVATGLRAPAWGARGQEHRGWRRSGAARPARGAGSGGGGNGGVWAFSACGHFKMRQRREGKRSTSDFEAQVYSSVNQQIYLGRATWALPRIFVGY